MSLDEKGQQIAYQVAWKGAIDLIATGKAIIDPGKGVGAEVKELADTLYASLVDGLVRHPPVLVAGVVPEAAPHEVGRPADLLTSTPCPECAKNGRQGVLLQNTDPDWRGPEFQCSLKKVKKVGSNFVDVGPCDFKEWGRNARKS